VRAQAPGLTRPSPPAAADLPARPAAQSSRGGPAGAGGMRRNGTRFRKSASGVPGRRPGGRIRIVHTLPSLNSEYEFHVAQAGVSGLKPRAATCF